MRRRNAATEPATPTASRPSAPPHLAKLDNNADVGFDLGAPFEFGLARLLDGFAALIEGRRRGRTLDG